MASGQRLFNGPLHEAANFWSPRRGGGETGDSAAGRLLRSGGGEAEMKYRGEDDPPFDPPRREIENPRKGLLGVSVDENPVNNRNDRRILWTWSELAAASRSSIPSLSGSL